VIEDEPFVRELIQDLLESKGFQALVCENGTTGVKLAQSYCPDLILCDVQMPEMDGYAVLGKLRQIPSTATIPFIFLTARGEKAEIRRGMTLGADDYLIKPCTAEDLVGAIASRLQRQGKIQSQAQEQLEHLRRSISLSLPHELRTPITGILSAIELLRLFADEPETILELADSLQSSTERLYRLVRNFLLYAELENPTRDRVRLSEGFGDNTYDPEPLIVAIATQVARRFKREADLQLALQPMAVQLPESDLEKILEELLDNAFKFSGAGDLVQIVGNVEGDSWAIDVVDRGRGMTPEQIARRGAYVQFDRHIHEQQGMGLGLSIAQRLLKIHGGSLVISSTSGEGTTMRILLPRSVAS